MKFSKAMSFISKHIDKIIIIICIFLLLTTYLRAFDLISGKIPSRENVSTEYSMLMGPFPKDFQEMLVYFSKKQTTDTGGQDRFLWYPLNFANYIFIPEDLKSKRTYVGTSFFSEATGQRDYPGLYSFGLKNEVVELSMLKGNFSLLCEAIWENNINYVITNNDLQNPEFLKRFKSYFTYEKINDIFLIQQTPEFKEIIFGEKLHSFGKSYDLFTINHRLRSDQVELYGGDFVSDNFKNGPKDRNWCFTPPIGKLPVKYQYDASNQSYIVESELKDVKNLTLILAENLGYRYKPTLESPAAETIETISTEQFGAKFYVYIGFKENQTGPFKLKLQSSSWLQNNFTLMIYLQLSLLLGAILFLVYRLVFKRKKL